MRFIDEFRDPRLAAPARDALLREAEGLPPAAFMEVCGTHTMSAFRFGVRGMLPPNVRLLSGPGCPVCVTPNDYLDRALAYARRKDVVLATFGDMMRVPGTRSSLERERAAGADIRVVYSPLDALEMARADASRRVLFLGVGFETTAPLVAASVLEARETGVRNFLVLSGHKLVPPALEALLAAKDLGISGFLCPGHVSGIIGADAYLPVARDHKVPCVVAGFEPLDMIQGLRMLLRQVREKRAEVENQYARVVTSGGNRKAREALDRVFEPSDTPWRGLGTIPRSGLRIRQEFRGFDAEAVLPLELAEPSRENPACRCGEVLQGRIAPPECPLFGKGCTPDAPAGACMVSSEGTCAAYHKYGMDHYTHE
jgi:hydrogenase expression/formation protein HypD